MVDAEIGSKSIPTYSNTLEKIDRNLQNAKQASWCKLGLIHTYPLYNSWSKGKWRETVVIKQVVMMFSLQIVSVLWEEKTGHVELIRIVSEMVLDYTRPSGVGE